ncbi:HesB/YadR/YfhF family protein [Alkalicoccus luteus]|uniref:HesB/YadR/YfhF family protein n=1 Tax=Alkalicoccus luteus TaxID=1237094 RepID=A0A969PPQ1_9BACI|nr:HesB/YadR/YfhF family protein [Alkalicoccus luteus]NJP38097.1 HesB/YadR/YfhF family protein [Alkalicoccus luteus]
MNLDITDEALKWFKNEVEADEGDTIKFFAKYGGESPIQSGFSIGFALHETPESAGVKKEKDGITFFVEEKDLWYFDGYDLTVEFDEEKQEIHYNYHEGSE